MKLRELSLNLEAQDAPTLTERIARAMEQDILSGRLQPETVLPGSRSIARDLGVTRNTVLAALDLLISEGLLESQPWKGVFVARNLPVPLRQDTPSPEVGARLGFDLPEGWSASSTGLDAINLGTGLADSSLAPRETLAKAYQRALRVHGELLMGQGEHGGTLLLRQMLALWVSERDGVAVGADRVVVTSGGDENLRLIGEAFLQAGDAVAVETPGNRAAWDLLVRSRGAQVLPVPVDGQGLVPEALEAVLRSRPVRLILVTPRCQFPTGAVLPPDRARRVLALAAEHRVPVFEDDSDAELRYEEAQALPLLARDTTGQVVFGASLSHLLAPGTRLGYLVVPPDLASLLTRIRRSYGTQGDRVVEWAFADFIRDGDLARHLRRARKVYQARRDHLCARLKEELGDAVAFSVPQAGLALWLRAREGVDLGAWVRRAAGNGLLLRPPSWFYLEAPAPCTRLGFSQVDEEVLTDAVRRLKAALPG